MRNFLGVKTPYFGSIYRVQKDAYDGYTAAYNKLADLVFPALGPLPVAGVFFGLPPADSTSYAGPDRSYHHEGFEDASNDCESPGIRGVVPDRTNARTETVQVAYY
jgi:hypothetical protein